VLNIKLIRKEFGMRLKHIKTQKGLDSYWRKEPNGTNIATKMKKKENCNDIDNVMMLSMLTIGINLEMR